MKLPAPNAPLHNADGTILMPTRTANAMRVSVPSNTEAKRLVTSTRRKLADLPALPAQLNSFAVVLVYTCSGLSEAEISHATGFTLEQLVRIRQQPAYSALEENVITAVKEQSTDDAKAILAAGQIRSAQYLTNLVDNDEVPDLLRLKAADSVLDRTGHKAVDKVDIRSMNMTTLRMEIVDKRGADIPILEHNGEV